mmetsp:Transcript_20105/g.50010  ORF Transcript_20105/g.50010 Transcript_20105/m.50010 type:complete len:524 (+) Transcript_20105:324-1895(+)
MPTINPRGPLHLLDGYDSASPIGDSLDSDSEVSDTSTFTNSPVSCYNTAKPAAPSSSAEKEKRISSSPEEDNDASSISSTDTTSADSESERSSVCCEGASDVACAAQKQEEEDTLHSSTAKIKKSVGFESLSTLYVFDDEANEEKGFYDVGKTWYSAQDLRAFRADAFLTVNWLVMKNVTPQNKQLMDELNKDSNNGNESYNFYSNKYGYDREKEMQSIAEEATYDFCERGVECRTPLGRYKKNKRRIDAMRVVMLYQHMQRQHRRERKREERRKQQLQYQDANPNRPKTILRRHTASIEDRKRAEADNDADALSNVYGSYCKDSASEALARGQTDAIAAGMPPASISAIIESHSLELQEEEEAKNDVGKKKTLLKCPSLTDKAEDADEEDAWMDKLVSLSFNSSQENNADDEDSQNDSLSSDLSLSLDDLTQDGKLVETEEVSGIIEVELIEDDEKQEHSHRIHCSEVFPENKFRRQSWSSARSLPDAAQLAKLEARPTSVSFSSLELGDLFFGAVTGLDWW